jgi:hypothetical protein
MKDVSVLLLKVAAIFFPLVLIFANISCTLPTYDSPTPGIIQVRLHTISTSIPFTPLNNFILTVSAVYAVRADNARLVIFQDVNAIDRTPSVYNTLDQRAQDSTFVMGSVYAPPGEYSGVSLLFTPGNQVIEDGYRFIPVDTSKYGFNSSLVSHGIYTVRENDTTRIYMTVNLDSALEKGADRFYFRQKFVNISSIH